MLFVTEANRQGYTFPKSKKANKYMLRLQNKKNKRIEHVQRSQIHPELSKEAQFGSVDREHNRFVYQAPVWRGTRSLEGAPTTRMCMPVFFYVFSCSCSTCSCSICGCTNKLGFKISKVSSFKMTHVSEFQCGNISNSNFAQSSAGLRCHRIVDNLNVTHNA